MAFGSSERGGCIATAQNQFTDQPPRDAVPAPVNATDQRLRTMLFL